MFIKPQIKLIYDLTKVLKGCKEYNKKQRGKCKWPGKFINVIILKHNYRIKNQGIVGPIQITDKFHI